MGASEGTVRFLFALVGFDSLQRMPLPLFRRSLSWVFWSFRTACACESAVLLVLTSSLSRRESQRYGQRKGIVVI
ncbi:hypothetical protein NC651_040525 [Populus alba x Populus x berolinensis]|nr:hypothetical protein NC651_040525 [Populus alba x Populus x berolinensis]